MPGIGEHSPNRGRIPLGRGRDATSRRLQDGARSLPLMGAKGTHSSLILSLQELRLQRELRGNVSQLRAFFLRSGWLDKQRAKSSCSPGEYTVHKDEPGKGFVLAYGGAADTDRAEVVTQEIQSVFRLQGQIPTGHAAIHVPYLTQGSHQRKSAEAQQFAAIPRVLCNTPSSEVPRCFTKPNWYHAVIKAGETEAQKD